MIPLPGLLCCLAGLVLVMTAGCSGGSATTPGGADASSSVVPHGGAAVSVQVSREALQKKPQPWALGSPQDAVRSYLAWASYAYRIAQSNVATPTMTPYEEVVVDSYIQYNIQKGRLLDQQLKSLSFGKASVSATRAVLPVKEQWTYRYVSAETPGKTLGGPYSASYDATYTVVKSEDGVWRVDHTEAKPLGTVK